MKTFLGLVTVAVGAFAVGVAAGGQVCRLTGVAELGCVAGAAVAVYLLLNGAELVRGAQILQDECDE